MKSSKLTLLIILLISILPLKAQDSLWSFSAYVDVYYAYDFSDPVNLQSQNSEAGRRQRYFVTQYDQHNTFALNHAFLQAQYQGEKVRSDIALHTGSFPINNYAHEPSLFYQMIHRANAGVKIGSRSWVDVGVMGGHFGYESALAHERSLLSPALATEYTPYYQTGAQYTWSIEKLEFRAVALNGWQTIAETDMFKSFGMAVDFSPSEKLTLSYGNYFGKQREGNLTDPRLLRSHHNFYLEYVEKRFLFSAIVDHSNQKEYLNKNDVLSRGKAYFITSMVAYSLSEKANLASRYEYVKDRNEILIGAVNEPIDVNIISACYTYRPTPFISIKFEPKVYFGKNLSFVGRDGFGDNNFVLTTAIAIKID